MSTTTGITRLFPQQKRLPNATRDSRFFFTMSIVCAVGVFLGFSRTYYLRTYFASHAVSLLLQVHGAVFTAWMIYFVVQTALIANRRISLHRRLGYAGAVLASAMVLFGTAAAYSAAKYVHFRKNPFTHNPEGDLFFSEVDILLFAVLISAGFYFRRNRQVHQRLMLMATVCPLMPSALARLPLTGHLVALVSVLVFLLVLAGPIYDLLTLRRIHRAYLWSLLLFLLTVPPARMLVGNSAAWYQVGHWLLR